MTAGSLMLASPALKAQELEKDTVSIEKTELIEETSSGKGKNILKNILMYTFAAAVTVGFCAGAMKLFEILVPDSETPPDAADLFPPI